jgi:Flp pilus assembly protein TadG
MLLRPSQCVRRTAAALVETAAIVSLFLMLLFGVLEYCRFLFFRQVIDNAAREGARYAVVNTNSPTLNADTTALIYTKLNKMDTQLQNFTILLYAADASGNPIPANPGPYADMSTAQFGTYIGVQISGDYNPITPNLLRANQTVTIKVKVLMCSEAN